MAGRKMPKLGEEVQCRIHPDEEYQRGIVIEIYAAQFMVRAYDEWDRIVLLQGDWHYAKAE